MANTCPDGIATLSRARGQGRKNRHVTQYCLCADDFALTTGVSRSILTLLEAGRLSATGAMTNRPHWKTLAPELRPHAGSADLGLHFNLTCARPLSLMPRLAPSGLLPSLSAIAKAALVSGEARAEIAAELDRQLDAFEDTLGRAPDFIDGHQHVHVLPGVRQAVLAAMTRRYTAGTVWLRDPSDSPSSIARRGVAVTKALVISGLAKGLRTQANRRGIPLNRGFSGVSPFDPARDYGTDFARFLLHPGQRHLIMCHPGFIDDELAGLDPVSTTRPLEHAFLMGENLPKLGLPQRFSTLAGKISADIATG
jgi:chitin disaccharide deacetylase